MGKKVDYEVVQHPMWEWEPGMCAINAAGELMFYREGRDMAGCAVNVSHPPTLRKLDAMVHIEMNVILGLVDEWGGFTERQAQHFLTTFRGMKIVLKAMPGGQSHALLSLWDMRDSMLKVMVGRITTKEFFERNFAHKFRPVESDEG